MIGTRGFIIPVYFCVCLTIAINTKTPQQINVTLSVYYGKYCNYDISKYWQLTATKTIKKKPKMFKFTKAIYSVKNKSQIEHVTL